MSTKGERSSFSSRLGFVLSAAGSAVGLGNIWRFPYLAAKYGGGIFLLVYLLLVLSFGYTMIIAESALGRRTKKSPVGAFSHYGKDWMFRFGGWVSKYLFAYLRGEVTALASDDYFSGFITNGYQTEFWFLVFTLATMIIIYMGVQNGIERVSTIMMPILIVLALVIALYAVTRPGAMKGVAYFLVPNFKNFSWMTVVAAMGQMFYSLSIAMGILMTFGSYMKDDVSIEDATRHVELFDPAIAVLAGLMIIPAVFAFSGGDPHVLTAGPSLMFITMPKIFANMGFGQPVGIMFFLLVLFAALTSAIALAESAVSTFEDELHWSRKKASIVMFALMLVLGSLSALGYGPLALVRIVGMQLLDFFDFLTNSVMMPIAAMTTCLLIVRVVGVKTVAEEVTKDGAPFKRRLIFNFMIKYLCPFFVAIILFSSVASLFGWIKM